MSQIGCGSFKIVALMNQFRSSDVGISRVIPIGLSYPRKAFEIFVEDRILLHISLIPYRGSNENRVQQRYVSKQICIVSDSTILLVQVYGFPVKSGLYSPLPGTNGAPGASELRLGYTVLYSNRPYDQLIPASL